MNQRFNVTEEEYVKCAIELNKRIALDKIIDTTLPRQLWRAHLRKVIWDLSSHYAIDITDSSCNLFTEEIRNIILLIHNYTEEFLFTENIELKKAEKDIICYRLGRRFNASNYWFKEYYLEVVSYTPNEHPPHIDMSSIVFSEKNRKNDYVIEIGYRCFGSLKLAKKERKLRGYGILIAKFIIPKGAYYITDYFGNMMASDIQFKNFVRRFRIFSIVDI